LLLVAAAVPDLLRLVFLERLVQMVLLPEVAAALAESMVVEAVALNLGLQEPKIPQVELDNLALLGPVAAVFTPMVAETAMGVLLFWKAKAFYQVG
jgi:hypothetical protein